MLNLSKITLLLLASIGLTACGLASLIKQIEDFDDDCPLAEEFCELNEDGEQINRPPDVNVDADVFTIANTIRGTIGTTSGILDSIEDSDDEVTYGEMTLANTEGGFAYFTDATGGFEYVGILDDTDLGNAFHRRLSTSAVQTATWDATIVVIAEGTPQEVDFPLEINFNSQEITGKNIQFAPVSSGPGIPETSRIGTLEGTFRVAGQSNAGQLTGTFDIAGDTIDGVKMYGLIGEDGAVGVFSGTYFGGFVAEPQ